MHVLRYWRATTDPDDIDNNRKTADTRTRTTTIIRKRRDTGTQRRKHRHEQQQQPETKRHSEARKTADRAPNEETASTSPLAAAAAAAAAKQNSSAVGSYLYRILTVYLRFKSSERYCWLLLSQHVSKHTSSYENKVDEENATRHANTCKPAHGSVDRTTRILIS